MTLTAPDARLLLKTRTLMRRAGFPPCHPAIATIQAMVCEYRRRVGMPTYLSEMLGPLAVLPASEARLYGANGEEMAIEGEGRMIDVLRVVQDSQLPWVVEVGGMVRYL